MLLPLISVMLAHLFHPIPQPTPGELALEMENLRETGRVLYVAAHPDDENTQFLAWAANGPGYEAAYLSLTRGDGGQNLIGDEQSPLLGVIRTWELLSARDIDGAMQYIGGVRDFGYSKSSEETLSFWGEEAALGDVVQVIRRYRPHVIVTRFPEEGSTHGHHLASGILARLAAEAAGDPEQYPEQLDTLEPWSPVRVVHNVPTWYGEPDEADTADWVQIDVGEYLPLLGRSFGEIAATSRSRHRSQGFGWWSSRGPDIEYFSHVWGDQANETLFDGIETSWESVEGGAELDAHLAAAREAFRVEAPELAVPHLVQAYAALDDIDDAFLRERNRPRLAELIVGCAGLVLDVRSDHPTATPVSGVEATWSALARTDVAVEVTSISAYGRDADAPGALTEHEPVEGSLGFTVPRDADVSGPFWLAAPVDGGRYAFDDPTRIGDVVALPDLIADFELVVDGVPVHVQRPVRHVWREPAFGERTQAVEVVPRATVTPNTRVLMLQEGAATVELTVEAFDELDQATVSPGLPEGFVATPESIVFSMEAGESSTFSFAVEATGATDTAVASPTVSTGAGWSSNWRLDRIDYEHIPTQLVRQRGEIRLEPLDLSVPNARIGYVMGPGDLVASSLRNVGFDVVMLDVDDISAGTLAELDTLLIGIRAFGTYPELHDRMDTILEWVDGGGALITQYQTNNRISPLTGPIGPADVTIGRGRVTVEEAAVTVLEPDHPVFTTPNAIGDADWDGWVQERGLYFGETWDAAWTPLLAMNDPGEEPLEGSLLVAEHGEGYVVYAGLSFFRQLPAGVPGGYRLLANLLALGDR